MAQIWHFKQSGKTIECLLNGKKVGDIHDKGKGKYTWVVYSSDGAFVEASGNGNLEDCRENVKIQLENGIE